MPLLHRKPFVRVKPPADLRPDERVFYCRVTNEIFRNYDDFFERTILCNSLVWSCAVTGKPGLTYQEALESERKARHNLQSFPEALVIPVLYLATLTHRTRLHEICDEIFAYVKDRYFVDETVEVVRNNGARLLNNCYNNWHYQSLLAVISVHTLYFYNYKFKEELERLRSTREYERETDWWSYTSPLLREMQWWKLSKHQRNPSTLTIRQKEGTSKIRVNGNRSLFGDIGESPPSLPYLPKCPYRVVINIRELIEDSKIGGTLGCSDHALVEFVDLRNVGEVRSEIRPLNFRKASCQRFRGLVSGIPWETALRDKGVEQSWQILKEFFHRAQELSIHRNKKSSKESKRLAWLSRELLVKLKGKKQMHRQLKLGEVTWEEYGDEVWLCRDAVRKGKAKPEWNLRRDAKNNKKGFYKCVNQKMKVKEGVNPLISSA
ncbi:hypothetical protein BTVI_114083 [Pitangus sulphuratus]|nr:hypothetical protein BTVI_114083 [Pitangus sulphuratus]